MKSILISLAGALTILSLAASAQSGSSDQSKPAVKIGKDNPTGLPVEGKSSFTSNQAKARMEARGYNILSNPIEDGKGIWYAEGMKNGSQGKSVQVMLDYQGNVFESGEYQGHPSSAPGVDPILPNPVKKSPPNSGR
jgi:hypothetical protein